MKKAKTQKTPKAANLLARLGISALLAAAVLAPMAARAADPAYDYRRTLFIAFGQKELVFEAPVGMCFLDQSDYLQNAMLKMAQSLSQSRGTAMAIFADCDEIANLGTENSSPNGLQYKGTIFWDRTPGNSGPSKLDLSDYLDMREAGYLRVIKSHGGPVPPAGLGENDGNGHNKKSMSVSSRAVGTGYLLNRDDYKYDKNVHRTADSVAAGHTVNTEIAYNKIKVATVNATTLLRRMPIDVSLDYTNDGKFGSGDGKSLDDLYAVMDTFMAQQQMLNRE
ncbi:MAG: hypothetical protein GC185_09735 [Alphaproteobacteria bacterium]|nr:hypothetical protein [Alphaproteobacteria bacterium]